MFTEAKPPLEELAHFGTKGMKWGVHKTHGTHEFNKKFNTPEKRATEIHRARASVAKSKAKAEKAKGTPQAKKLKDAHLKNPDRATALRITKGEKAVRALLYAFVPVPVVPAAVAANTVVRVGRRRKLEP
jgi:hypothetical protein